MSAFRCYPRDDMGGVALFVDGLSDIIRYSRF
jgi:hypothetical protein